MTIRSRLAELKKLMPKLKPDPWADWRVILASRMVKPTEDEILMFRNELVMAFEEHGIDDDPDEHIAVMLTSDGTLTNMHPAAWAGALKRVRDMEAFAGDRP